MTSSKSDAIDQMRLGQRAPLEVQPGETDEIRGFTGSIKRQQRDLSAAQLVETGLQSNQ
jgi:hypothetical protein